MSFFGWNLGGQDYDEHKDLEEGTAPFGRKPHIKRDPSQDPEKDEHFSVPSLVIDTGSESDSEPPPKPVKRKKKEDPYLSVLSEVLNGTGRNAFGIAAIEAWVMGKKELTRCRGGYWRDPVYPETKTLNRLENPDNPDFVVTKHLVPGLGVAGTLWSDVCGDTKLAKWFDLQQLAQDEDQPYNLRLNLLAEAFGLATGMYFHNVSTNTKGIIVFYARGTVNFQQVSNPKNLSYLRSSADLIGAVVSWEKPRLAAMEARSGSLAATCRRVRSKILALKRIGALDNFCAESFENKRHDSATLSKAIAEHERQTGLRKKVINASIRMVSFAGEKSINTVTKIKHGGGQAPPPGLGKYQVLFALIGCFLSLLTLSLINQLVRRKTNDDISILLGPLGALVTCHYGLTSAPASQPRNSFLSIIITASMALFSTHIPSYVLPVWIRVPLVTSIGIATTLSLGLAHPPAGAIAIIFSKGDQDWTDMGMLLFGYVEAIFFAMVFINLHESRTFPMYWGVPSPTEWFCRDKKQPND